MIFIRSLFFNIFFYSFAVLFFVSISPLLLFPLSWDFFRWIVLGWGKGTLFLLKTVAGIHVEIRGEENMKMGPCLYASKHQSAFDTIFLHYLLPKAAFVLKKELLKIPIYGQFIKKQKMIHIERKQGLKVLKNLVAQSQDVIHEGRSVIIFPEGTRTTPGQDTTYFQGIGILYEKLQVPVVPVAVNSGVYWSRRGFLKYPGTIVFSFLDPIYPGLSRVNFMSTLKERIENECKAIR